MVKIMRDQDIFEEATEVLLDNLGAAKMARFWAAWQIGTGDYATMREHLFAEETVQTLYEKIQAYQRQSEPSEASKPYPVE